MALRLPRQNDVGCPATSEICGTTCTSTLTDAYNCGKCGKKCPGGSGVVTCSAGVCGTKSACPAGTTVCGSTCYDFSADAYNCGNCGLQCPNPGGSQLSTCLKSACVLRPRNLSSNSASASAPPATSSTIATNTGTDSASTLTASPSSVTSPGLSLKGSTSSNVSAGAAAGIGIGCAVIGALLAGLALFFILSRRNRRKPNHQHSGTSSNNGGYIPQEKSGFTATVANVDRLLPQPTEDDAMIAGLSKIRDAIKNHVQNYYHTAPVDPKMMEEAGLVELARVLAIPTSGIMDLLLNPATRVPILRLYLGHLILSRCSGQPDTTLSFLPSEVSALAASDSGAKATTAAEVALFSKWKTISGTLLQQRYSQQPSGNDPREASIAEALTSSELVLRPFVNPSIDTNVRRRNLEGIMRRAAQYAFLMFSQPSSFIFDYTRTGHPDGLVVFPALLITVNDEGKKLSPPRVLSEKEVVAGLGRY